MTNNRERWREVKKMNEDVKEAIKVIGFTVILSIAIGLVLYNALKHPGLLRKVLLVVFGILMAIWAKFNHHIYKQGKKEKEDEDFTHPEEHEVVEQVSEEKLHEQNKSNLIEELLDDEDE